MTDFDRSTRWCGKCKECDVVYWWLKDGRSQREDLQLRGARCPKDGSRLVRMMPKDGDVNKRASREKVGLA